MHNAQTQRPKKRKAPSKDKAKERGTSDGSALAFSSAHRGPSGPGLRLRRSRSEGRATGQRLRSAARIEARQGRIAPAGGRA